MMWKVFSLVLVGGWRGAHVCVGGGCVCVGVGVREGGRVTDCPVHDEFGIVRHFFLCCFVCRWTRAILCLNPMGSRL